MLSRYTFLLFFPLEIAGFCCENSSFGPEHEIVEIEFGSCFIQPLFSTLPGTFFPQHEEKTLRRLCLSSHVKSCTPSVRGPALGCVLSVSLAVGIQKACLSTLRGLSMAEFPLQTALQHGQRQGLAAWFY